MRAASSHLGLVLWKKVVLIKREQGLEELIDRSHHLLRLCPRRLDLVDTALGRHHVLHRIDDGEHRGRGRGHRFELGQRGLVEVIQRLRRLLHGGLRGSEVLVTLRSEGGDLLLDAGHLLRLDRSQLRLGTTAGSEPKREKQSSPS